MGPGREADGGGWARLPPQDPRAAHLDHLRQRQLGRPLQPQQGPHEVLRGREQVTQCRALTEATVAATTCQVQPVLLQQHAHQGED